jgi:hypothetical protein
MSTDTGSRDSPWVLHLPRRAVLARTEVAALAHRRGDFRNPRELEHRFGLHSHEHRFVEELLRVMPQLWVFRCDQLRSCGDFALVDMSAPLALRRCVVMEHKQRKGLRATRHRQLENHERAVDELVRRRVLESDAAVELLFGSAEPPRRDGVSTAVVAEPRTPTGSLRSSAPHPGPLPSGERERAASTAAPRESRGPR